MGHKMAATTLILGEGVGQTPACVSRKSTFMGVLV